MAHGIIHGWKHGWKHNWQHGTLLLGAPAGPAVPPNYQAQGTVVVAVGGGALGPISWPTHQANDIGVLFVTGVFGSGTNYAAPAGWTEVTGSPQFDAAGALFARLQIFWRRATSGAEADVTVADIIGDDSKLGQILTFRGCTAAGDPTEAGVGNDTDGVGNTSVQIPGTTTLTAQTLVVAAVGYVAIDASGPQLTGGANGSLSSFTEQQDFCSTSSIGYGFGVFTGVKTIAGGFGTTSATLPSAVTQARICFALKPI